MSGRLVPGQGNVHVEYSAPNDRAAFANLGFCYPLKLMPPRLATADAQLGARLLCLYMLTYGGGLVSGDTIDLTIKLDSKTHLVLLTQGNTKVFRERPGGTYTPAEPATSRLGTFQRMVVDVQPAASLFLLPAPVTCFENSIYSQHQTFHLADDSTLLLLDWFTSGRLSRGESWAFERYRSCNEVCIGGVKVVNDVLLLEGKDFRKRMSHYACYCTVLLCGPGVADLLQHFRQLVRSLRQYKRNEPDGFIWSFSELEDGKAGIVRCAGLETETVKNWLAIQLVGLREIIGLDTYKAAFV